MPSMNGETHDENMKIVDGIIRGDPEIVRSNVLQKSVSQDREFPILPAHTITIHITAGKDG